MTIWEKSDIIKSAKGGCDVILLLPKAIYINSAGNVDVFRLYTLYTKSIETGDILPVTKGTITMSIGLIMTAAFAVYLVVCVVCARIRGVTRSRIRMITVIVSAVLALVATLIVKASLVSGEIKSTLYNTLGESGKVISDLAAASPVLEEIILKTGGALIAPLLYFVFFLVFSLITWVLYFIVTLALIVVIHRKEKTRKSKNVPCLIQGLVQGVICLAVLLIPISTYSAIAPKITGQLTATMPEEQVSSMETINKQVNGINKSPAVVVFRVTGGKLASSVLTDYSVKYNGEKIKVKLTNEIDSIAKLASGAMELTSKQPKDFTEAESQAIVELGQLIGKSKITSVVATEFLHNATGAWREGQEFMGVAKPETGELVGPMFDKLVDALYTGSEKTETFNEDIETIAKLVAKLVDTNVLTSIGGDTNQLVTAISQKGVVTGIAAVLEENPRLRILIPEITTLSVKILAQSIGIPENDEAVYVAMLNNIAGKLNELRDGSMSEADKITAMEGALEAEFAKAGVEIEDKYISDVAVAIVADFGDSTVTVDATFISEFFDIYSELIEDNQNGVGGVAFSGIATFEKLNGGDGGKKYTYYKYNPDVLYENTQGIMVNGSPENSSAADLGNYMIKVNEAMSDDSFKNLDEGTQKEKLAQIHDQHFEKPYQELTDRAEKKGGSEKQQVEELKEQHKENKKQAPVDKKPDVTSENLASLKSKDSANTNATTVEKLTNHDNITAETLTKEEVQKEAEALEGMLGCAAGLLTNENASIGEVIKGVGEALDNLAQTEIFGKDKTGDLFEAVIKSDTVGGLLTEEEKADIIDKVTNSDNLSYGSLFTGVSSIVDFVESLGKSEAATVELDVVKNLIQSLTEENVDALSSLITGNRFGNMGIPEGKLDKATALIKDLLTEIGKFADESRIDDEAKAVKHMLDIALTAKGGSGSALFGEGGRLNCTAYEMIETIMASTAVRNTLDHGAETFDPFGLVLEGGGHRINEAEVNALKLACDAYYADHCNDAGVDAVRLDEELTMLASIFGIVR